MRTRLLPALLAPALLAPALAATALLAGPAWAFNQQEIGPNALPAVDPTYRAQIARWSRRFYPEPDAVGPLAISRPALMRDLTGRLLWLVCVDVSRPPAPAVSGVPQRLAFGFAPRFFSAPHERSGTTLTAEDCDGRASDWRSVRTFAALRGEGPVLRKRHRTLAAR